MKKITIALSALGIYAASLATQAVFAAGPSFATISASELARYVAANGGAVTC